MEPLHNTDYLSHSWEVEDVYTSWKILRSRNSTEGNTWRLDNAAWRIWGKTMNGLKTVSPESIHWLKDADITWLYGPFQKGPNTSLDEGRSLSPTRNRDVASLPVVATKPILKKQNNLKPLLNVYPISSFNHFLSCGDVYCKNGDSTPPLGTTPSHSKKKTVHFSHEVEMCAASTIYREALKLNEQKSENKTSRRQANEKTSITLPNSTLKMGDRHLPGRRKQRKCGSNSSELALKPSKPRIVRSNPILPNTVNQIGEIDGDVDYIPDTPLIVNMGVSYHLGLDTMNSLNCRDYNMAGTIAGMGSLDYYAFGEQQV